MTRTELLTTLNRRIIDTGALARLKVQGEVGFRSLYELAGQRQLTRLQRENALYLLQNLSEGVQLSRKRALIDLALRLSESDDRHCRAVGVSTLVAYYSWWPRVASVYEYQGPGWVEFGRLFCELPVKQIVETALNKGLDKRTAMRMDEFLTRLDGGG